MCGSILAVAATIAQVIVCLQDTSITITAIISIDHPQTTVCSFTVPFKVGVHMDDGETIGAGTVSALFTYENNVAGTRDVGLVWCEHFYSMVWCGILWITIVSPFTLQWGRTRLCWILPLLLATDLQLDQGQHRVSRVLFFFLFFFFS